MLNGSKFFAKKGHFWLTNDPDPFARQHTTMASLCHIHMGRNDDYFLNYIDYSKGFDAVLKILLVI